MMRDGGEDEVEDVGWQNAEDAPIPVERGEIGRDGREPEVVATSDGECVVILQCATELKTQRQTWWHVTILPICLMPAGVRTVLRHAVLTTLTPGEKKVFAA